MVSTKYISNHIWICNVIIIYVCIHIYIYKYIHIPRQMIKVLKYIITLWQLNIIHILNRQNMQPLWASLANPWPLARRQLHRGSGTAVVAVLRRPSIIK